jgi:HlyD family secretion protein
VKKGQVIAKIDPQIYAATVEQARSNVAALQGQIEAARATLANAELVRKRNRVLRDQKLVAQQDLDTANANADVARGQLSALQGQLKQSRAALHQAQINLAYTDIVSPTDGTVISRNVDVGQTVAAAFQAPTLFVIAEDLRKMQVDTNVAEADVGKLRAGMEASFTVDAWAGDTFRGRVREVRNNPQTLQNVVTYDAVIDVDNRELKLKPGMTANVTFVYGEKAEVLRVANAALRFRAPETWTRPAETKDRRTLWVLRDGKPAPVSVKVGMSDGTSSEIVDGDLRAGEPLITDAGGTSAVPPAVRRVL